MLKGLLKEEEEEEKRRERKKWKEQSKNKMALHTYLSMITLNVSGLIASSIRCRVAEWIGKQDHIYAASRELSQIKRYRLNVKEWKNIFHANGNKKFWGSNMYIRQNRL